MGASPASRGTRGGEGSEAGHRHSHVFLHYMQVAYAVHQRQSRQPQTTTAMMIAIMLELDEDNVADMGVTPEE